MLEHQAVVKRSGSMLAENLGSTLSLIVPILGPMALTLVVGLSIVLVPRIRWNQNLKGLGLAGKGPGVYRGRAIEILRSGSAVTITIRTQNSARLYDEFSSKGSVPGLPWISEMAAMQLNTLAFARDIWDHWHIRLKGQSLQISCATVRPERLRFLLDLACDLADGVDRFGEERPRLRLHRRLPI